MMQNYIFDNVLKKHRVLTLCVFCLSFSTNLLAQDTETTSKKEYGYNNTTGVSTYNPLNYLTYTQQTNKEKHYALGQYKVFSNAFTFAPISHLKLTAEGGPVTQQSFFSPLPPNIHLYYRAEISYAISDYVQPYIYTQHLSAPLNQNSSIEDDNLRLNPFFMQSEIGTGVKTEVNGYLLETGVRTMTDPTLDAQTSSTQVFSKIIKKF
ncbi:hypothetical protein [Formosa sp. PL04]|uniref:hypothetical protein n=1 Tax=Formosa sp. PL04 TaxID=3081755 RepID=UPI0029817985|nr:hypothetical protein [Formosa sp. PL04]MDW5287504.1 hypothetical protein [Formosa sp. PL04]